MQMATGSKSALRWVIKPFHELDANELYGLLKVRVDVFVVEQNCAYSELDGKDMLCDHVIGHTSSGIIGGTARIAPPGTIYDEVSIGRVAILKEYRGMGAGYKLMQISLSYCHCAFGPVPVKIAAQQYLESFYNSLGFRTVSAPFDWDGIPHVYMYFTDWPTL